MKNLLGKFALKNIKLKTVLFLFIVTNLIYTIIIFLTIPEVMKYSNGMKILDMLPMGYNPEYANKLLNTLSEKGRQIYLTIQIPIDMIYPGIFALSYSMLIAYLLKKIKTINLSIFTITLFPIFAGLFDYFENVGIIIMLKLYPTFSDVLVWVFSAFSVGKSLFTICTFVTCLILLSLLIQKRIKSN